MTSEELLGQLYDQTLVGDKPAVLELTNAGLAMGLGPETLLLDDLLYYFFYVLLLISYVLLV